MSLYELVRNAQNKNESSQLLLIEQFTPLLKKYANKLNLEDAYEILLLDFLLCSLRKSTLEKHSGKAHDTAMLLGYNQPGDRVFACFFSQHQP